MLFPAYTRNEELNNKFSMTVLDQHYKFYHLSYVEPMIDLEKTFWNKVALVSLNNNNEVCGFFKAEWARPENYISSVSIINFDKENQTLFAIDTIRFFKYLMIDLKAKKVNFYAVIGNPAIKNYDRLVEKLGGRVVGIRKYNYLIGNEYYDSKLYEIINDHWECNNCGNIIKFGKKDTCKKCKIGKMVYKNPFK